MKFTKAIIGLTIMLFLAACTPEIPSIPENPSNTNQPPANIDTASLLATYNPEDTIQVQTFASKQELKEFLSENSQNTGFYGRGFGGDVIALESADMAVAQSAPSAGVAQEKSSPTDFSQTNNQVAEVDEADIIKTDGDYIYTVTGQTVFLIDSFPAEDSKVVSQIHLEDQVNGIFIQDDTLAVFGTVWQDYSEILPRSPRSGATFLHLYDVSNRNSPELLKEYVFEGSYFQGRLHDGHAYIVTLTGNHGFIGNPLPFIVEDDVVRTVPIGNVEYFSMPYNSPQFATIHALNLESPQNDLASKSVLVESGQVMYMAPDNMYIVHTKNINEYEIIQRITIEETLPLLSEELKKTVERIQAVDGDILSKAEKHQKIINVISSFTTTLSNDDQEELQTIIEKKAEYEIKNQEYFEFTIIHKIHVDETDIEVVGTAQVPGSVNNQFSLDEYKNTLRVATTLNRRWSTFGSGREESSNNVFTLDKDMNLLDELMDIAPTETIFSARFVGDTLYLVTFRQVDPFFTIDLSNPRNIKLLGELKIPGFSRYLHPYDENTIIGIGRDATLQGRQEGLKISLFDVSDIKNPKEQATYTLDEKYASSSAEYEHKAFLFSREKNLLVIPLQNYNWQEQDKYNGALVFKITNEEIELRGLVAHDNKENFWQSRVERSLYIEDNLYTKSPNLLRINALEDLSSIKDVKLSPKQVGDIPIY